EKRKSPGRAPRRGLQVDVEVDRREEEAAQRENDRPTTSRLVAEVQAPREGEEEEGPERDVQGEQQRQQLGPGRERAEQVRQVADRRQRHRHAFVQIGVPERQLAGAQPLEREAAQRKEVEREIAEVQARTGEGAAQERKERHDGGEGTAFRRAALPLCVSR